MTTYAKTFWVTKRDGTELKVKADFVKIQDGCLAFYDDNDSVIQVYGVMAWDEMVEIEND
jgi:hypothetical protein